MMLASMRPVHGFAIPVLLYHSVDDEPAVGQEPYTVTPKLFGEHVAAIADAGCTAMTISELVAGLRGDRPLPARPVAVTFDDTFANTQAAVERLREAGIPSTIYVQTNRIGLPDGPSVAALRELAAAGTEVGAHTVSHPYLESIPLADATQEIAESRSVLEQHMQRRIETFAYPHGAYDRHVRAAVIAAGFTSAVAVKNALSHPLDDPFAIARWTVMHDTSTERLALVLTGHGLPLAWRKERRRTRAARRARRLRRRVETLKRRSDDAGAP